MIKALGIVILGVAIFVGIVFGGNLLGLWSYSFFAPRYTAVQNKVFHESQAYNDGMIRDLENLKREYQHADANGKDALRSTILHRFEIYPRDRLPPDLANFYDQLEQPQ